ncbi:Transcriptional regulator, TraR/DksA family [Candidatus Hydrogenisulfobacillus filiaventi]|uniref:Transcriptional regulator, TraR/DksA family n=1 Tax=Candidatus Hydrogenisulfobacillus filiaventi TaxID=2707344 RepID=A0A6F8ZFG5_9FIRM|nr:TraR/DksA C4-type zinc finger protein [Bacillota bacterium]CAB1128674.1 Transcriptional regulator, TraR/DksA family [Candidatus Hydrogenisulfobacillus filiaventi]
MAGAEAGLAAVAHHLEALRNRLRVQLSLSETGSVGALSSYDNHPADLGSDTAARELDAGILAAADVHLQEVERALEKLHEGTYGRCDRCGGPIEPERLQARPESVLCAGCQAAVEPGWVPEQIRDADRIARPFGTAPAAGEPVEVDGADTWQDLARMGNSDGPQDLPPGSGPVPGPLGTVEPVEAEVDVQGEPDWETVREARWRHGRSVRRESDRYPPGWASP